MHKLKHWLHLLKLGLEEISSWAALVVTLLVTVDVILRYIFRESIPAATEITQVLMVIMIFLVLGKTQEDKEHIRVEFLIDRLSPKIRPYWEVVVYLFALAFISMLFKESIEAFRTSFASKEFYPGILRVPIYPGRGAIVTGCGLMMIEFIKDIVVLLTQKGKLTLGESAGLGPSSSIGEKVDK